MSTCTRIDRPAAKEPILPTLCESCGTLCIMAEAGKPPQIVAICPACPMPYELAEPICRQPRAAAC
jgi:hypothetical protein